MKRFQIRRGWTILLCLVAVFCLVGCDDDDPPESIAGTWSGTFSSAGEATMNESWTFVQDGQNVTGSYTFGDNVWAFTATYVEGAFSGVDKDNWALNLTFKGDEGSGTIAGDGEVWNATLER